MSNPVRSYAAILSRAAVMVALGAVAFYYHTYKRGEEGIDWFDWMVKIAAALGVILTFGRWIFEPFHCAVVRFFTAVDLMSDVPERVTAVENRLTLMDNQRHAHARRLRVLFEQSGIASFEADVNGDLVSANQTFAEMCGLGEHDLRGRGWLKAVHEDDRTRVWERWTASRNAGLPYSQTFRLVDQRGGKTSTCRITATAFCDETGAPVSHDCTVKTVNTRELLGQGGSGEQLLEKVAADLTRAANRAGLERCASMDVTFDNGDTVRVPIVPDGDHTVMPGVLMRLLSQSPDATEYQLEVEGAESLPWHSHRGVETVKVQRGTLRDEDSGKVYGPGDTWTIPAGQRHSVRFRNCIMTGTILPGLPTVKEAGMDMSRIGAAMGHHPL